MMVPTHADVFVALLLQAADEGRGAALFGESEMRARTHVPPFLVGRAFPDVYLEHPLEGDASLDVTLLLRSVEAGTRVPSASAGDHAAMMDLFAEVCQTSPRVSFGFELDTSKEPLPTAAVHFQPRAETSLVRPFCEAAGDPGRADAYLAQAERMPAGWPLSFFGMFRGRPNAPLRVCGYLSRQEVEACADDPAHLARNLACAGFCAFDDAMLEQACALLEAAPGVADFQLDVLPDGSLGPTFALDIQFAKHRPEVVREDFRDGGPARVMAMLDRWGASDGRWRQAVASAFARAIPVETPDGRCGRYALTLMPQWVKARWTGGALQPSKLYHLARAQLLDGADGGDASTTHARKG